MDSNRAHIIILISFFPIPKHFIHSNRFDSLVFFLFCCCKKQHRFIPISSLFLARKIAKGKKWLSIKWWAALNCLMYAGRFFFECWMLMQVPIGLYLFTHHSLWVADGWIGQFCKSNESNEWMNEWEKFRHFFSPFGIYTSIQYNEWKNHRIPKQSNFVAILMCLSVCDVLIFDTFWTKKKKERIKYEDQMMMMKTWFYS